ncbi:glycosyltransferase [Bacillus sp. AK128]
MKPKISIIVPVYKVEPYLEKCIESILSQTFRNFELILINDGSPDNCGNICDGYSKKDSRIKVIHKQNGGLSSARNAGLEIAQGDYIGFVDSDDWIEPEMYELLLNLCEENNCEISSCSSIIHYSDKTIVNGGHTKQIYNRNVAMRIMLEGDLYDEVVWTKIFKRNVIGDIRFTEGIVYEDTDFTYRVIHNSSSVGCIGKPMYHYIKRENSTMDQAIKNIRIDSVLVYNNMFNFLENNYPELKKLIVKKLTDSCLHVLRLISINNRFDSYKNEYYSVVSILNNYFTLSIRLEYPRAVKILLIATKIQPFLYRFILRAIVLRKELV